MIKVPHNLVEKAMPAARRREERMDGAWLSMLLIKHKDSGHTQQKRPTFHEGYKDLGK